MKRALILDLDNTIYPVSAIAGILFGQLFKLIDDEMPAADQVTANKAKEELTRRPYQHVADEFGFSAGLKAKGIDMLKNITFNEPMQAFKQYEVIRAIKVPKYLVTTGFTRLQMSKVEQLGIQDDFKAVYVVDPEKSALTKKDIFKQIMQENSYQAQDVLVIGDDPLSEIKAAAELGIDTFLFDPENKYPQAPVTYRAADYTQVVEIINK